MDNCLLFSTDFPWFSIELCIWKLWRDTSFCKLSADDRAAFSLNFSWDTPVSPAAKLVAETFVIPRSAPKCKRQQNNMTKLAICHHFPKMIIDLCLCRRSKGGAGSWWAQSPKPVLRHGNLQRENKAQTQIRLIVQLMWESKSQGRKAPPTPRSQEQAQGKSSSTKNQNNFIKRQIGLAVPHLGSWRQPTKLAQPCRAPWHWVQTTHSIWVSHTESHILHTSGSYTCLHGLLLFHRPHNRLFCHFKCFKDYHPNAVFSD